MTNDDLRELQQFLGAYFHQDWAMDISEPDQVVHLFIEDGHRADELVHLAGQIERFVAGKPDDAAVEEALFSELGCYYRPSADGLAAGAWLRHVARLLVAAA